MMRDTVQVIGLNIVKNFLNSNIELKIYLSSI